MNGPAAVVLVALVLGGLLASTFLTILFARIRRVILARRLGRLRDGLSDLPVAVALDDDAPPPPQAARARRLARDLVLQGTQQLSGVAAARATRWLDRNGFVDEALTALGSRATWRRAEAAHVLGRLGSARAEPALIAGLGDHRYTVRDACAGALGRVGGAAAVIPLIQAMQHNRVPHGRVFGSLVGLSRDANRTLAASIQQPEPQVRALVARVLGGRGAASGAPALLAGLADPSPEVRRQCALALGELGSHGLPLGSRLSLVALADDGTAFVRAAAASVLGSLFGDRVGAVLVRLAADEDHWVGHRAAEAIAALPSGLEIGWAVLADPDPAPGACRARAHLLERLERSGAISRRLQDLAERGSDLPAAIAALRRAGARAWRQPIPDRA